MFRYHDKNKRQVKDFSLKPEKKVWKHKGPEKTTSTCVEMEMQTETLKAKYQPTPLKDKLNPVDLTLHR